MPVSDRQPGRQPPWEADPDREAASFGTWLRRQREIREIPLREIADVTKISIRYLEALEQDRFEMLPAPVFAKGFLREYSKYVGLDPDEVVNSYLTAGREEEEEEAEPATVDPASSRSSGFPALVAFAVLLAVLVLVFLLLRVWRSAEPEVAPPPIAAPVIPPSPVVPAGETETADEAAMPLVVTMDFTEDCWVEAEVDGERRLSELHVQGESMRLEAESRVSLTLGNPAGVRVEVNGERYELDVAPGRVARDVVIDLEDRTPSAAAEAEEA